MNRHWSVQLQREQLHRAAEHGNVAKVRDLLERKYPVNRLDELGKTPLHYAAAGEHLVVVDMLLRAGAKVDAHDERMIGNTPLADCAKSCSLAMAKQLIDAGADPTIPGWMKLTAIDRANENPRVARNEIVELLEAAAKKRPQFTRKLK